MSSSKSSKSWSFPLLHRCLAIFVTKVPLTRNSGFTLIEVMIVLSIVAIAAGLFLSRIDNTNNQFKSAVREIGTLSRNIRYHAKLNNVTYRLVINMHSGEDSEITHEYWVEKGSGPVLLSEGSSHSVYDERKARESQEASGEEDEEESKDEKPSPPSEFAIAPLLTPKKKTLPGGLIFQDVEVASVEDKVTSGTVYIHYFPQGFVDESVIHIKYNKEIQWTIAIHPLTGKTESSSKYIRLKEILDR